MPTKKQYVLVGGSFAEGGRMWDKPGDIVESENDLPKLFPNAFRVADGPRAVSASKPDPGNPIRRTAASEAQDLQKPNRGHAVPIGASPPDDVDEENANAADEMDEEKFDASSLSDPDYGGGPGSPSVDLDRKPVVMNAQRGETKAAKKGSAKAASKSSSAKSAPKDDEDEEEDEAEAEDEEDEEEEEAEGPSIEELEAVESELGENVTDQFPKAVDAGLAVVQDDKGKYHCVDPESPDEAVEGSKQGHKNKTEVNKFLKKHAG